MPYKTHKSFLIQTKLVCYINCLFIPNIPNLDHPSMTTLMNNWVLVNQSNLLFFVSLYTFSTLLVETHVVESDQKCFFSLLFLKNRKHCITIGLKRRCQTSYHIYCLLTSVRQKKLKIVIVKLPLWFLILLEFSLQNTCINVLFWGEGFTGTVWCCKWQKCIIRWNMQSNNDK